MINLSDDTFELLIPGILSEKSVDLRNVNFIDPYGMMGILEAGRLLRSQDKSGTLILPESQEVLKYLERMDFFRYADRYYHLSPGKPDLHDRFLRRFQSDVLLEISPIEKSDDVHYIVRKVRKRAGTILSRNLRYNEFAVNGFLVALSEVCQNIIEHSENTGLVGIQKYHFQKQDKNVVKIAVMDLGIGFKNSLSARISVTDEIDAIEKALVHGVSRYMDKSRGHGLTAVRKFVRRWNGKISIRSGTARFSIIPDWAWGKIKERNLVYFPGAQINIMLPEV